MRWTNRTLMLLVPLTVAASLAATATASASAAAGAYVGGLIAAAALPLTAAWVQLRVALRVRHAPRVVESRRVRRPWRR